MSINNKITSISSSSSGEIVSSSSDSESEISSQTSGSSKDTIDSVQGPSKREAVLVLDLKLVLTKPGHRKLRNQSLMGRRITNNQNSANGAIILLILSVVMQGTR
ncbi:hypothetical protein BSL78_27364 [Apostichopus japonicus]|uniref:Uncharacterized protein n=1 Tax=Stichopus japonicus TaxID=307972 RepID=A0A2G8JJ91_STIJA|nr:hypothetical protein BSL78_27364 [Apostichopus japonicus]